MRVNPYNPYEAPQMNDSTFGPGPGVDAQAAILEAMKRTRPWVLFLSILGFLGAAGMFLVGFFMLVAGTAMTGLGRGPIDKLTPFLSLFYFVLGAFQLVPSTLLFRFGSAIGNYTVNGGTQEGLAAALQRQASFWRFTGIATLAIIGLYFVLIFVAIAVGVAAGLSR